MADIQAGSPADASTNQRAAMWGPYWHDTNSGAIVYLEPIDDSTNYVKRSYTTDAGSNWSQSTFATGGNWSMSVWHDKETPGISSNKLNIVYAEEATSGVYFNTLDLETNAKGTQFLVGSPFQVSSAVDETRTAITKTVNGNLIFAGGFRDAGILFPVPTKTPAFKSTDGGSNWSAIGSAFFDNTNDPISDWGMLYPADTADDADAAGIFWDDSASELSVKMYDDSAGTWTETSISTGMTHDINSRYMDAAVRHSDSHILLASHTNDNNSTDDIKTWDITPDSISSPTVTAKTDVFTNQAGAANLGLMIDQSSDDVYVAYSSGTSIFETLVVYKKSTDDMSTWGSETEYSETKDDIKMVQAGRTVGSNGGRFQPAFFNDDLNSIYINQVNDIEITGAINYTESLSDSFTLTDSLELEVVLSISDSLSMSDSPALEVVFSLSDTQSLSDSIAIGYGEGLSETFTITDSLAQGQEKALTDSQTMSDSIGVGEGKGLSDSQTMSDSVASSAEYNRTFTDTYSFLDTLVIINEFTLFINDQQKINDSLSKTAQFNRVVVDDVDITDSISYGAQSELINDIILKIGDFEQILRTGEKNVDLKTGNEEQILRTGEQDVNLKTGDEELILRS